MGILSAFYALGLSCHKAFVKPRKLPAKVISVGNMTIGGTGKTPAVISLAKEAKRRGFSPCVLTRGYKGKTKDICFVSTGDGPLISAAEAGDEAFLMAESLTGVPVVKGANRYEAGMLAMREYFKSRTTGPRPSNQINSSPAPDPGPLTPLFILDDGHQHWALERDINIVLVDAAIPFGNGKLLPEGPLREPLSGLSRADMVVLTRSDMATAGSLSGTIEEIMKYNARAPVFRASHKPVDIIDMKGNAGALDFLSRKRVYAFAAIAKTLSFESLLRAHGAEIVECKRYRDHYFYAQNDMDEIKQNALGLDILTTEKDLVKLRGLSVPGNVYALRIEFSVSDDFYTDLFRRLQ